MVKEKVTVHTALDQWDNENSILYFNTNYLKHHSFDQLLCFSNTYFQFPVSINHDTAISLPNSPFGSIIHLQSIDFDSFQNFIQDVIKHLKSLNVGQLTITHPSTIYESFIPSSWLESVGFKIAFEDINQHIIVNKDWKDNIHDMQKRKLKSLENDGFQFEQLPIESLEKAHSFIEVCRQVQELKVNISYEKLKKMSMSTGAYEIFAVTRNDKISALCIAVNVQKDLSYYYLPGTSPLFRNQSPMVLLIAGMVNILSERGWKTLDLGVSSIHGNPQESLRLFKNRMGAIETTKSTWTLQL